MPGARASLPRCDSRRAIGDDHVVATSVRLPDGTRVLPELIIGPFGAAIIEELPPPGAVMSRGVRSWEVRVGNGYIRTIENPLERAAHDAERVRGWLSPRRGRRGAQGLRRGRRYRSAVERTATCALIAPRPGRRVAVLAPAPEVARPEPPRPDRQGGPLRPVGARDTTRIVSPVETSPPLLEHVRVRCATTAELSALELAAIRTLMDAAFGDDPDERFGDDDWAHSLGGTHVLGRARRRDRGPRLVVARELHVGGRPIRTGYVEAVATAPAVQGRGIGSRVMREIGGHIREDYELGALGTGAFRFYERLGWQRWLGPSSVRTPRGPRPTPDDDGFIMVLPTPSSPPLDPTDPISCDWRPGDVW